MENSAIIPINFNGDRPTVSGRELHSELGVSTEYRHWFPRMCEYGFVEGKDFNPVIFDRVKKEGDRMVTRTIEDHELTLAMAKEISMLQRNEAGKRIRQYLIQVEEAWNEPGKVMARALILADRELTGFRARVAELEEKVTKDAPKVLFANSVEASSTSILIGELAKILKQNGVDIGQNRLFAKLRELCYLIKRKGADYNMPTQKSMELGLFTIKETAITHSDGHVSISKTVKVTGKGQQYFINLFLGKLNGEPNMLPERSA